MVKLIAVLVSGIPAIIAAILAFVARKLGTAAGSIVAFIAMTVAFIFCEHQTYDALIALASPPAWLTNGLGMFIPGDFSLCLSSYVSAKICRAAYDMGREKLKFINNAS